MNNLTPEDRAVFINRVDGETVAITVAENETVDPANNPGFTIHSYEQTLNARDGWFLDGIITSGFFDNERIRRMPLTSDVERRVRYLTATGDTRRLHGQKDHFVRTVSTAELAEIIAKAQNTVNPGQL